MLPIICRCCGKLISTPGSVANANMCASCERLESAELPLTSDTLTSPGRAEPGTKGPTELEQLVKIDGPSVVEFTNALEQAREAIAEVRAEEEAERAKAIAPADETMPGPQPS